jgi:hypothetical protein
MKKAMRVSDGVWHAIHSSEIMEMLNRVANGENPELVYLEHYANAENCEGDDD